LAAVIVTLLLIVVPPVLLLGPVVLIGRRRGWSMRQYVWPMVIVGVGWGVALGGILTDLPFRDMFIITLVMTFLAGLFGWGLVGWEAYFKAKREQRKT
jgi:hypothetical protein